MAYPTFTCAYEKEHNPPLNAEADGWFQQARALEKVRGVKDWRTIVGLYEKAIAKDHWKAMHNLAGLYRTGWPGQPGVEQDTSKMLDLYERMVKLKVPLGYYNWAVVAENGRGVLKSDRMASSYMFQAAQLGSPLAQVQLGQYFAFGLPRDKQDDDMAERYYRCAGAQEDPGAILKTASFYKNAKLNMPLALFYYQRAASLGESMGFSYLSGVFESEPEPINNFGYPPDPKLHELYTGLWKQLRADRNLRFPNLMKDHPLPPHPKQGFDAEHPNRRPEI
ncbi:tetratricopeptide repeat protein [Pseudomonas chlororaphis]|uniref:tetratricopeptide repeat protein n=1 Tax=Pseudomonas chlororaphis TaxID=587753 RepID=UPI000E0A7B01|nr:tetratricopeptide repeat protein [Pseudomonas chlororaphis]WDH45609.1 tetratricopeptide repeat protein [Pseudomonas chlororaphis]WDH57456.1 tetratricopeptide repeat protein [Pseudomonas chlororaphis]WQE16713.1 tetratricopeptide repeat protein [Pseudomonas chlororaphis]